MENTWKLGEDMIEDDNLMNNITFYDLILALHCNCPVIDENAVRTQLKQILDGIHEDMEYLLENNMDEIISRAKAGRE